MSVNASAELSAQIATLTELVNQMKIDLAATRESANEAKELAKQAAVEKQKVPVEVENEPTDDPAVPKFIIKPDINFMMPEQRSDRSSVAPTKMHPYKSGDFKSWFVMFESYADVHEWQDDRRLKELFVRCQGSAEHVIRNRTMVEWTYRDLKQALLDRLCKPLNGMQVLSELEQLTVETKADPDEIMTKIEEITHRADESVSRSDLQNWMRSKFMSVLHSHRKQVFFYVGRKCQTTNDPYEALKHAKEHARKHGYETDHIREVVKDVVGEKANSDKTSEADKKKSEDVTVVAARFLPTDKPLGWKEVIARFNEIEEENRRYRARQRSDKSGDRYGRRDQSRDRYSRRDQSRDRYSRRDQSSDRYNRRDRSSDRGRERRESRSESRYDRGDRKYSSRSESYDKRGSGRNRFDRKRSQDGKEDRQDKKRVKFEDSYLLKKLVKFVDENTADTSVEATPEPEKKKE